MVSKMGVMKKGKEFFWLTFSTIMMAVGVYFFKFPNNFTFGGVTGFAVLIAEFIPLSASDISFWLNMILLAVGFGFFGKRFGAKTAYTSILLSVLLSFLERIYPMKAPFTNEPMLELCFAIALPALGSAILFNMGASSGGTDVIAMILKKYTSVNIGMALLISDVVAAAATCFIFDIRTGLFAFLGLTVKSFMVDGIIENIHLCKYFTVVCTDPDPICHFIIHELKRSATKVEATGAFSGQEKHIINTVLSRTEAVRLRNYSHRPQPSAFVLISNTSEIVGKGFHSI